MGDLGGVGSDERMVAAHLPRYLFQRFNLGARVR